VSLYLKYRPADFNSLVWQEFTKQTLQKAISENKTVWAYLFCGPRWTGKTSSARIFAKAINCLSPLKWNPCLECKVCVDFADERLVDIIEIDAASHTWVDNIREIIERAQFSPNFCKYKIYIVDEVHMLSKWAFNALLKILEEPPSHVKFILATTETHKVPDTIISRCQRYDFKRISSVDIKNRLEYIAWEEKVSIDDKSLDYIVKNSWGWLRNAISLFEQLINDNEINYDQVVQKLWIVDDEILENFLNKLLKKDTSIIEDFDELISDWKNIKLFFKELIFYTKNIALIEIKNNFDISKYIYLLEKLDDTYGKTKNSLDENTTFTIWVLKIISNYSVPVITESQPKQTATTSEKNISKSQVSDIEVSKEKISIPKEEISQNDALDVFGTESEIKKEVIRSEVKSSNSNNLDTNKFISELKNIWAKWALTMALRWSWLELLWNTLIIRTKTKIASWQVANQDNISLMCKALESMWIENPEIKPN
jgi:DNA polymerase III subunit gamma/tau